MSVANLRPPRSSALLAGLCALILLAACQNLLPPTSQATAEASQTAPAAPTDTPSPAASDTPQPEPASPTPPITATPTPEPSPTPTPRPTPTFYTVQPGDTLAAIAAEFDVSLDDLLLANGYASLDDFVLFAGDEVQIPLCEAHEILVGNTLAGIALLCDADLDALLIANIATIASHGSLEALPPGTVLVMPAGDQGGQAPDCSQQPAREEVIEYTPQPNEGPFCLGQKFGLTPTAVIQANIEALTGAPFGEAALHIPPANGALYVVTPEDVAAGVTVQDLATWYEVVPQAVTDWSGNPVSDPLESNQQLFIRGAELLFGPFRQATPTPAEATPAASPTP
ncbi:MAG: LysM peptidoglycan-binding domain-containing protein [Candidatus Promineifilaceae bacterium]